MNISEESRVQVMRTLASFSQLQLVIGVGATNFYQAENIRKMLFITVPMQEYPASDDRWYKHGKEETLTGHDGTREIDGFLIDAVGSETEDI